MAGDAPSLRDGFLIKSYTPQLLFFTFAFVFRSQTSRKKWRRLRRLCEATRRTRCAKRRRVF